MAEDKRDRILSVVGGVVGQPLWSAIGGPRGDYVLALELGPQRRRSMRLANPRLTFLQRTFEGDYSFLIECPWRLEDEDGVVTSCLSMLGRRDPPTTDEFGELYDREVVRVDARPPAWDLDIELSGGMVLRCFSAEVNNRSPRNNWAYWSPSGLITVGPKGEIKEQTRAAAEEAFRRAARVVDDPDEDDD